MYFRIEEELVVPMTRGTYHIFTVVSNIVDNLEHCFFFFGIRREEGTQQTHGPVVLVA